MSSNHSSASSYNCPLCEDKGVIRKVIDGIEYLTICQCTIEKNNKERLQNSGLINIIDRYTFDGYKVNESWQKAVKDAANKYIQNPTRCFFIGGESGSGKTHICTAICGELLKEKPVRYMSWMDENIKLKSNRNNEEEYNHMINVWKRVAVLYIDDFFKTQKGGSVTGADVLTAYEILNYRYMQPNKLTIISSELSCEDIMNIDAAIGGRIIEMADGYILYLRGSDKNQRLQGRIK